MCVNVCMFVVDVQNELYAALPSDSEDEPGSILDALLQVAVCHVSTEFISGSASSSVLSSPTFSSSSSHLPGTLPFSSSSVFSSHPGRDRLARLWLHKEDHSCCN